ADAPSGTAERIGSLLKEYRGYTETVHGRSGLSKRGKEELEILSARVGGVPGIHDVIIAGQHEMLRLEHTAFSRSAFAQGALLAVRWLAEKKTPGVYNMGDVLFTPP
ncbi:MAG: dihydrodipicolinate reductase C-terminal domain-containing protein, partial [Candidatus Bathyarchaeia archaeon]